MELVEKWNKVSGEGHSMKKNVFTDALGFYQAAS